MNRKKIMTLVIAAAIVLASTGGVAAAVHQTTGSQRVMVVRAGDLNYGGWGMGMSESLQGTVNTDVSQNIYLSHSDTVKEILVKEGQAVKEGDVLLVYDTKKTALALQREKLEREGIELGMEIASKNLETLKKLVPVTDGGFAPMEPEIPEEAEPKAISELNANSLPLNLEEEGAGSADRPYRFFCEDQVTITRNFAGALKKLHGGETAWFYLQAKNKGVGIKRNTEDLTMQADALDADLTRGVIFNRILNGHAVASSGKGTKNDPVLYAVNLPERGSSSVTREFMEMIRSGSGKGKTCLAELYRAGKPVNKLVAVRTPGDADVIEDDWSLALDETTEEIRYRKKEEPKDPGEDEKKEGEGSKEQDPSAPGKGGLEQNPNPAAPGQEEGPGQIPAPTPSQAPPAESGQPGASVTPAPGPGEGEGTGGGTSDQASESVRTSSGDPAGLSGGTGPARTALWKKTGIRAELAVMRGRGRTLAGRLTAAESEAEQGGSDGDKSLSGAGSSLIPSNAQYTKEEIAAARAENEALTKSLSLDLREMDLKIRQSEKALADGEVRAKLSGTAKKVGDWKKPPADGSPLIQVVGEGGVYVTGGLKESLLGKVREGDPLTVTAWESGITCEARIKEISLYPDTRGQYAYGPASESYYPFTAYIEEGGEGLKNNEYVNLEIYGSGSSMEESEKFYLLKAFVLDENGEKVVYKRGEKGRLVRQPVEVGTSLGDSIEIRSGLGQEDWIAFPYGKSVREGARTREGSKEELYS